jgi:hypothetical protein
MSYSTYVLIDIESGKILYRDRYEWNGPVELCDKKAKAKASQAADTARDTATGFGSEASSVGSTLVPELRREATAPPGFMPADLNAMLVGGEQGAGGAAGTLAGEAGLSAARSRNTGALSGTLGEVAREKLRTLSGNALGVQAMNAREKARQKTEGLTGLEHVRGEDIHAQVAEQGLVPEDIKAMLEANKSGWGKNLQDWATIATGAAKAYKPGGYA